jgi:cbb3-type cytochrome oxidase subunit 1
MLHLHRGKQLAECRVIFRVGFLHSIARKKHVVRRACKAKLVGTAITIVLSFLSYCACCAVELHTGNCVQYDCGSSVHCNHCSGKSAEFMCV